jgi:FkbM family methyltransferase
MNSDMPRVSQALYCWGSIVTRVRERFHPLYRLRKNGITRRILQFADREVWLTLPRVDFKVRGRLISHGIPFAMGDNPERKPVALALACVSNLEIRSFWDVGANIGYYTWLLCSASPSLSAVLFEPLPDNASLIECTLTRVVLEASLVVAAASEQDGQADLRTDRIAGATSSLEATENTFELRHWGVKPGLLQVRTLRLDSERERRSAVDFIKIDVEEHEAAVLAGARNTIAHDQPLILIECGHTKKCFEGLEGYIAIDADHLTRNLLDFSTEGATNYCLFPRRWSGKIDLLLDAARISCAT